jgi:hypothetical protein
MRLLLMSKKTVQNCKIDPKRVAPLKECMENYGVGDADAEWPHNAISRKTVAYSCGALGRTGDRIEHNHDPAELELCRRLSSEVAKVMKGTEVGMGSEDSAPFEPFFVAANVDTQAPKKITEPLIREVFRGVIYPPATIWVEPLREKGKWWSQVRYDCSCYKGEEKESYLKPWRAMIKWFHDQEKLHSAAFVMIGDDPLDNEFKNAGCVFPRLALGLTEAGSVVGICGHVVHT